MRLGCFVPSELPQNAMKPPIYDFVVQPRSAPETIVKVVLMPVLFVEVLNIPSHVPLRHPTTFCAQVPETSKIVTYSLQF